VSHLGQYKITASEFISHNSAFRDFDAPRPGPADTSSATIAASGLLLLSQLENSLSPPNSTGAIFWRDAAVNLLNAATEMAWKPSWQSLLSNGTVNNPANPPNNLTGIVYGTLLHVNVLPY
jgi:hypothetical protein